MRILNETDAFVEAKRRYQFDGTKRYNTEKLDAFLDGFEFAEKQLKPLFVEFSDWCEEYELKQVLDDIFVLGEAEYKQKTTEELFELFIEEQIKK